MVGIRVGAVFAWLLGKSGSLLIILVVLLLSLSLLVQISWLEFLNGAGRAVQNRLSALSGKVMALRKRLPNTKTDGVDTQNTRRMVKKPKHHCQTRCLARRQQQPQIRRGFRCAAA